MRYKCAYCGCIFDEDEAGTRTEHEEFWGAIVPIYYNVCPECGEDISDEDEYEEDDEDEYIEEEEEEEEITLTEEQIIEMWENGYISDKEEFKDGND